MKFEVPEYVEFLCTPLPDEIYAAKEREYRALESLAHANDMAPAYFIQHTLSWPVGSTVTVGFKGGDETLRENIEDAVVAISDVANLCFNFRQDNGSFIEWAEGDEDLKAQIRICFDRGGYWSLVGSDSANPNLASRDGSVGGIPGSRSMCFGGFDTRLPPNYASTVRHEFLHAIGFLHAHQSPNSNCDNAFRWNDDDGYRPTVDTRGVYVNDTAGRRPGVYTMMSGAPNYWSRSKVNSNMKPSTIDINNQTFGEFDPRSIMLYRFPNHYYHPGTANCQPIGNGKNLSALDIEGLKLLYPHSEEQMATLQKFAEDLAPMMAAFSK